MRTAIFTNQADTPLHIIVSENETEPVVLTQMGHEVPPKRLERGANTFKIGPGVFRIFSQHGVAVTSTDHNYTVWVAATRDKDGNFPDTARLSGLNQAAVAAFFEAKGQA